MSRVMEATYYSKAEANATRGVIGTNDRAAPLSDAS